MSKTGGKGEKKKKKKKGRPEPSAPPWEDDEEEDEDGDDWICVVCLEAMVNMIDGITHKGELPPMQPVMYPCGHAFHKMCIEVWRKGNKNAHKLCPTCKQLPEHVRAKKAEHQRELAIARARVKGKYVPGDSRFSSAMREVWKAYDTIRGVPVLGQRGWVTLLVMCLFVIIVCVWVISAVEKRNRNVLQISYRHVSPRTEGPSGAECPFGGEAPPCGGAVDSSRVHDTDPSPECTDGRWGAPENFRCSG